MTDFMWKTRVTQDLIGLCWYLGGQLFILSYSTWPMTLTTSFISDIAKKMVAIEKYKDSTGRKQRVWLLLLLVMDSLSMHDGEKEKQAQYVSVTSRSVAGQGESLVTPP